MKNNNYTSFFKMKPKKVERYIRCRKCDGNMEWVEYYPPEIKCPKCGIYCISKTLRARLYQAVRSIGRIFELYEKVRTQWIINTVDANVVEL